MIISAIYNLIIIPVLSLIIVLLKPFNKKLRERENNWEKVFSNELSKLNSFNGFRVWFHSASMGEFEQAKPIIENLKSKYPEIKIIVSFFSPSGYNNQKNYIYADSILYLPFDSIANVKHFMQYVKPSLAVFVRYEIWRNFLRYLKKNKIPTFLICATRPNQKWLYKIPLLKQLTKSNYTLFKKIYTVSQEHTKFFEGLKINSEIQTLSDTRFDRIIENVEKFKKNSILPKELFNDDFILVAGSTWEKDEEIITTSLKDIEKRFGNIKLIIVPHEPTERHINKLKEKLPNSFFLTQVEEFLKEETNILAISRYLGKNHIIVDSIGKLLSLYSVADFAYVGGAFGAGVHSVTEPAGFGIPLSCGPKFDNSPDAVKLHSRGSLSVIKDKQEFSTWLVKVLTDENYRAQVGMLNKDYIYRHRGSTNNIVNDLEKEIFNSNNDLP